MQRRYSPIRLFITLLVLIFSAEIATMFALGSIAPERTPLWVEAAIDASVLTALTSVCVWGWFMRPLRLALMSEAVQAKAITDSAAEAIVTIDQRGLIRSVNPGTERMFGYEARELVGKNVTMLMPALHAGGHDGHLARYIGTGEARMIGRPRELSALRKDGSELTIELNVSEIRPEGARFFIGIIRDITERKRTEERLRWLSHAVEQSPAATVITDTDGRLEYVNPKFLEVTGYAPEELIGKTPAVIKSGLTPGALYQDLWRTILSGGEWRGEMQNRKKNGELYWEYEIISALKNERGEIVNFIAVKEDITERKRAVAMLQQELVRRRETEQELLNARIRLADADRLEAVACLAAGVAHEVKNPLAIIRLGIDYLSRQFARESDQAGVVDDARAAVDRADSVIRSLLNFARHQSFTRRPTHIGQVIDHAVHLVRHETALRNIEIVRSYDQAIPPIPADPDRLVQVFINLLSNAVHAIGRDGRIEVVARAVRVGERDLERDEMRVFRLGEPAVTAEIRDNGSGIPAEHKKRLFEPLFTTKSMGEGTGLGLAVSRHIVIMHGGSISISNRPEGGASALLMLRADSERTTHEEADTGGG